MTKVMLFVMFFIAQIYAERNDIGGRVFERNTGKPLKNVQVFLANTYYGTTTDKQGRFVIESVPSGHYELFVSMMGYHVEKRAIEVQPDKRLQLEFNLKVKIFKGTSVSITGEVPRLWKKHLKIFSAKLLGPKHFAEKCKIVNPEILDFTIDESTGIFITTCDGALKIENRSLGYIVTYIISKFEIYANDTYSCSGDMGFKRLQARSERESKRWAENRLEAYHGSTMHFIRATVQNSLKKDGFTVWHDPHQNPLYQKHKVNVFDMLLPDAGRGLRELQFDGLLEITYKHEEDEVGLALVLEIMSAYWQGVPERKRAKLRFEHSQQKSILQCLGGGIIRIDPRGIFLNQEVVRINNYWNWERLSEWLPLEYNPLDDVAF
ncbi:carboxypeptidase-like regulatory domain-containing protein [bacterium]|nr:carboxypeptidase-like regulatory domain-containing protein [bacterium]